MTPHFTARELNVEGAPTAVRVNAQRVAELLERVRAALGNKPVTVTSGYRPPARNAAAGGASTSQHLDGSAADFKVAGYGRAELARALEAAAAAGKLGEFGQLIVYPYTTGHAHISLPRAGKRNGEVLRKLVGEGYQLADVVAFATKAAPSALVLLALAIVAWLALTGEPVRG